jgi:ATP-binding cassette subfamily B protein
MTNSFTSEDVTKTHLNYLDLFKRLRPYLAKHWIACCSLLFLVVFLAMLSRVFPWLISYAIDHGISQKDIPTVTKVTIAYLVLNIIYTILSFAETYWFQKIGNRILFYIRYDLTLHVQSLPLSYFNKTPTGRIITRLTNDVTTLGELFTDGVITVFIQFIRILSIIIAMSLISFKLTVLCLFLSPLFIYLSLKISHRIQITLRESKKILSSLNSFVAETLNGIKVVQLYNNTFASQKKFSNFAGDYRDVTLKSIQNYAFMMPTMNIFNAVIIGSALFYSGSIGAEQGLAVGSIVAFFFHAQDFIYPIREIIEKYQQFQNSLTSAERVFSLFDEKPEEITDLENTQLQPSPHVRAFKGLIEIKDLNFKYEEHLPLALKSLNLTIPEGTRVGLIGRTGSGKSTLISLLQKFYQAPPQTIFIDGKPIEDIPLSWLRKNLGVVQQDNYIFKGTILNNITLGDSSISREKAEQAAQMVGLLEILHKSQRHLESSTEERGANLSVGERQLLSFARILAFEPDILILDEATANIDSESERLIREATDKITLNRTSIIIAHRLSTIEKCDQIIKLENGSMTPYQSQPTTV